MLVADTNEVATSATLGGKETIAFGISDDPAFFHVLSTSLYNNPTLAVVRETICNSWDAHIEAGKTDTPIRITIDTDNFITFRDFGNGIPDELIGSIYGVYGASTKKSNSSVTGGFGLGCKSPLAYTDSFQVTSWNQGKMSVYNVAKAAIENDGKPGIVPIVTGIPTEESGLEVKFQLGKHDLNTFVHYIKSIVFNGEIKAELSTTKLVKTEEGISIQQGDYTLLDTLGMSFEPGSYDMSDSWYKGYMGNSNIFVRYGNVMYPIVSSPASEEAVGLILNFMNIIGASNLVVQAAPDTLAIAPSRETLSNQKLTDDGITTLCVDLVDRMEKEIKAKIPEAIKQVEKYASESSTRFWEYPSFLGAVTDRIVKRYMSSSLWAKQRKHHIKHWRNLSNKALLARPEYSGLKKLYGKAMRALKHTRTDSASLFQELVYRHLHLPQLAALKATGIRWSGYIVNQGNSVDLVKSNLTHYFKMYHNSHQSIGIFTTKNVVVTRRLSDCADSFSYFPEYNRGDLERTAFVHIVGPKKGAAEEAVAKFTAMGYRVIDLTQYNEWDKPTNYRREQAKIAAEKRAKTIAANKTKAGGKTNALVSLNAVLGTTLVRDKNNDLVTKPYIGKEFADPSRHDKSGIVEVEQPKYYVLANQVGSGSPVTAQIGTMWKWYELSDEMKAETVVCRNQIEANKAKRRGAIHIDDVRFMEMMSVITSKGFKKYVTEHRIGILEYVGIDDREYWEILDILGLTFKPLQNLIFKPEYEWAYDFLRNQPRNNKEKLVEMGCIKSVDDLEPYIVITNPRNHKYFEILNSYKGLFSYSWIKNDILQKLDLGSLVKHLKKNPEDIPGFKSLYRNRLNKLKGN